MKSIALSLAVVAATLSTGCTSMPSPTVYSAQDMNQVGQQAVYGTVVSLRQVAINKSTGTTEAIGAGAGALVGGVAGHATGGGNGKVLTTAIGGVVGGVVGSAVAQAASTVPGWEMLARTDSGEARPIVQEVDAQRFRVGGRVALLTINGRSRAVAIN